MKPYMCIVNDLALLKNLFREINYRHQKYMCHAISCYVSIIVTCINLLLRLRDTQKLDLKLKEKIPSYLNHIAMFCYFNDIHMFLFPQNLKTDS